jgi:Fe-S-cluster containining protein
MVNTSSINQGPTTASALCQSCGLCCTGVACGVAIVSPTQDKTFFDLYADSIIVSDDHGNKRKKAWINQPCPVFDGNCSAYEFRPVDCKTFQCALLEKLMVGAVDPVSAKSIVDSILGALDKLAVQYNALNEQCLTRDEIFPVLNKLHRGAVDKASQSAFWRTYPQYLSVRYLIGKHMDK